MHVTTQFAPPETASTNQLKILSLPGILTIIIGAGIIFIGIREFLQPAIGAQGYGVPLQNPNDAPFLAIKAARDIATGIVALSVLAQRNPKTLATAMAALTLIPILDGLIVFSHAQWIFTPIILIHWGTAAVMLIIVALLRRKM